MKKSISYWKKSAVFGLLGFAGITVGDHRLWGQILLCRSNFLLCQEALRAPSGLVIHQDSTELRTAVICMVRV